MSLRTIRSPICFTLAVAVCGILPLGCGSGSVPDGGQINVTIPKEQAVKQNDAFKNYSKTSKKGKPPG